MNSATFETQVSLDGSVSVRVPAEIAQVGQKVLVTVQPMQMATEEDEERRQCLEDLAGSIPDLQYERGSEGKLRDVEAIE